MRKASTICWLICCWLAIGWNVKAQTSASAANPENIVMMPPALQNMQGIPGYNDELQKWQNSQNQDPALQKAEIQKNVDALKNAKWETAVPAVAVKTDSQGVPYHDYKGIVDPVAAKKAWETDQKENAH